MTFAVFFFFSLSPDSKDRLPAGSTLPTSIPHAEYACGSHDEIYNHIPDGKWQIEVTVKIVYINQKSTQRCQTSEKRIVTYISRLICD